MNVILNSHYCPPKSLIPCNKAIEIIPEGTFVCPYSGRKFNLVLLASCFQVIGDDGEGAGGGGGSYKETNLDGGGGDIPITFHQDHSLMEEMEIQNELIINKKQEENIECVLQQMIEEKDDEMESLPLFPFEAYLMELERVYKLIIPKVSMSIEEYVVSTLYIMMEGFGTICPEPNLFLKQYMPTKTTELKARGLQKNLITTGKSKWRDYLANLEVEKPSTETIGGGKTEKHTFFKLKKRKIEITNENISHPSPPPPLEIYIKNHIEIIKMYEKTKDTALIIKL